MCIEFEIDCSANTSVSKETKEQWPTNNWSPVEFR
jgi:hypothetical protein